jgi:hypothetical protein
MRWARLQPPLSVQQTRQVTFFGVQTQGRSVAYVCASPSSSQEAVNAFLKEMRSSVAKLDASQSFNVYFLARPGVSLDPHEFIGATQRNKDLANKMTLRPGTAADFIQERNTNHGEAMAQIMRGRPDVVYLVTDSDLLPDGPRVVDLCRREANGARIYTVALTGRDNRNDPSAKFIQTLQQIANNTGGAFVRREMGR